MNKSNEFTIHLNLNINLEGEILNSLLRTGRQIVAGQKRLEKSMGRLTDSVEALKTAVLDKLNEAVEIIRDPDQDSEQAAVLLEDFRTIVLNYDLTPDDVTPEP